MSEFMRFESTKSIRRWRPPKGTADLERSRVSGCRRSPRPPAMIIASRRARRGIVLVGCRRTQTPGRVEVREAEIVALEPSERFRGVGTIGSYWEAHMDLRSEEHTSA